MKYQTHYRSRCLASLVLCAVFAVTSTAASGQQPAGAQSKRNITPDSQRPTSPAPSGSYYALVIGNNSYRYVGHLKTAENDARALADMLKAKYGFQTKILLNATREDIFKALVEYRKQLPENSSLLIYYAGHGNHDRDTDEAYWLPVDAQPGNPENWVSADDITRNIRAIAAKHILIISDSCYSGVLTRDVPTRIEPAQRDAYLQKMQASKSRNLMSSGSDEPVSDEGSAGHSVFAKALLDAFQREPYSRFTAGDLFQQFIQPSVAGQSSQLPQYSVIRESGHDFGDFVFARAGAANVPDHEAVVSDRESAATSGRSHEESTPVKRDDSPAILAKTSPTGTDLQQLRQRLDNTQVQAQAVVAFWADMKSQLAAMHQPLRPDIQAALGSLSRSTESASRSLQAGDANAARMSLDNADEQLKTLKQYQN